jgi:hypothetical protein
VKGRERTCKAPVRRAAARRFGPGRGRGVVAHSHTQLSYRWSTGRMAWYSTGPKEAQSIDMGQVWHTVLLAVLAFGPDTTHHALLHAGPDKHDMHVP